MLLNGHLTENNSDSFNENMLLNGQSTVTNSNKIKSYLRKHISGYIETVHCCHQPFSVSTCVTHSHLKVLNIV